MDIQAEKKTLVQLLLNTDDVTIIKKVKAVFVNTPKKDWWNELSEEQKEAIQEGLDDFENGRTVTYEEFKKQLGIS